MNMNNNGSADNELSAHMRVCEGRPSDQAKEWLKRKPYGEMILYKELLPHGRQSTWKDALAALKKSGHYTNGAKRGQWLRTELGCGPWALEAECDNVLTYYIGWSSSSTITRNPMLARRYEHYRDASEARDVIYADIAIISYVLEIVPHPMFSEKKTNN
jgi:hypothetical protein